MLKAKHQNLEISREGRQERVNRATETLNTTGQMSGTGKFHKKPGDQDFLVALQQNFVSADAPVVP